MAKLRIDDARQHARATTARGDFARASSFWQAILAAHPEDPEATAALAPDPATIHAALALDNAKDFAALQTALDPLLARYPSTALFWTLKGVAAQALKLPAAASLAIAAALDPQNPDAHRNHAQALRDEGQSDAAIAAFRKSLALRPDPQTHRLLARHLESAGHIAEAITEYRASLALRPDHASTLANLATLLHQEGNPAEAEPLYEKALAADPGHSRARTNLGALKLQNLDFAAAWPLLESRSRAKDYITHSAANDLPLWQGAPCRLLLWGEQGIGDEALFASLFTDLAARSQSLTVLCDPRLLPLFRRSFPSITFESRKAPLDPTRFDAQISTSSALAFLRPSLASFWPAAQGYLCPDPALRDTLRARLTTPIIGLSWFTSRSGAQEARKIPLASLVNALPPKATLLNLQYGETAADIAEAEARTGRPILTLPEIDTFNDLDGFSALIAACDRVVSIDNSNVHLAGALGVPCDVLLPHTAHYRWGQNGASESYWYRSLRLFWQPTPGEWGTPLAALAANPP